MSEKITGQEDIPRYHATSSIGEAIWPPRLASEQRMKGIYPQVVETVDDLATLIGEFDAFPFAEEITRYSARLVVGKEVLKELDGEGKTSLQKYLEGFIDLEGTGIEQLEDCIMVYVGKNHPTRTTPTIELESEINLARGIFSEDTISSHTHDRSGYSFREIDGQDRENKDLINQYAVLYRAFGWNEDQVRDLLENPNNTLIACFEGDMLVSAGMAERGVLNLRRRGREVPLVMYEITEAATSEAYRGKGLYTEVARQLLRILAQRPDTNLVYAESNLSAPGVLKSARQQGRRSSLADFDKFGFVPHPLIQAVRISGGVNDTRPEGVRNDLLPTYMTRRDLIRLYGD